MRNGEPPRRRRSIVWEGRSPPSWDVASPSRRADHIPRVDCPRLAKIRGDWIGPDGLEDGQDWPAEDFASQSATEIRLTELGLYERLSVGATGHLKAIMPEGESNTVDFIRAED